MNGNNTQNKRLGIICIRPFLCCLILLVGICRNTEAKPEPLLDKKQWEKTAKGADYTEHFKDRAVVPAKTFNLAPMNLESFSVVFYVLIIGLLAFIVIRLLILKGLLNINPKTQKTISITLQNFEDNLEEADLQQLLNMAVDKEDYPLAIRIQFLTIIKQLNESKLIIWKKDKTNGDYLKEFKNNQYYADFRQITMVFEKIWYGGISLTITDYMLISGMFTGFTQKTGYHES
jgi:hypothetical protein